MTSPNSIQSSIAIKHINAMMILTLIIPLAWIGYMIIGERFTTMGVIQSLIYYGLMFVMLSGMKKGNGKNRKFVGYINLIGVISVVLYLSMEGNQYPVIGIALIAAVWAYVAWACLFSKEVKSFLDTNESKT